MASINGVTAAFFVRRNGAVMSKDKRVSPAMRLTIYERDGGVCVECGDCVRKFARHRGDPFVGEVDHIVPRSRGGRTEPRNLRLICRLCNRRKSNA
jgi:5-methylcytosine-specific restriction endonuclease McrA